MLSRIAPRRVIPASANVPAFSFVSPGIRSAAAAAVPRRWATPAPHPKATTPLMSRVANRDLPDVDAAEFKWRRSLPWFLLAMAVSAAAIINYQKMSSSAVASILYALRTSPRSRELLGDEIYFASRLPWISGEMAQMQGRLDISFRVRGTRGTGRVRFASCRPSARATWETVEYSLDVGGEKVDLLVEEGDAFAPLQFDPDEAGLEVKNRGFRQVYKD